MMRKFSPNKILLFLMVLSIIVVSASGTYAFDKERKGFILGMGLGPGFSSYTKITDSLGTQIYSDKQNKIGVFTDFKLGYAPNDHLMIYWMSKVAWSGRTDTLQQDTSSREEDITVATGIGGLGVTYFFNAKSPSLFVTVGAGFTGWSYPFEDRDFWTGIGVTGGVGWEFRPNWVLEASFLWGKPKYENGPYDYSVDILAAGLTFSVIGY
jgi:hypothetical protein